MDIKTPYGTLHVVQRAGDGDRVVFVHGLGADAKCFEKCFAQPVLGGSDLIAPDLLGFGESDKPADFDYHMASFADLIETVLDALSIKDFHLVGHSMGGTIAVLVAQRRPADVRTLIVAEPNLVARDATMSRRISARSEAEFRELFPSFVEKLMADARQSGHAMIAFADSLRRSTAIALHRSARSLIAVTSPPEFVDSFLSLPMPKHYLISDETLPSLPPPPELVRAHVPIHVIENCGHGMMVDNPAGFCQAIGKALALTSLATH